jgi:hypothetical protein
VAQLLTEFWFAFVVVRRAAFSAGKKPSRTKSRKKYVGDLLRGVFMGRILRPAFSNIASKQGFVPFLLLR